MFLPQVIQLPLINFSLLVAPKVKKFQVSKHWPNVAVVLSNINTNLTL